MTRRKPRKVVVNRAGEILLYGVIGEPSDGLDATSVVQAIKALGNLDKLAIRINSGGGSVRHGLAIYNFLADHRAKKIVKIDAFAASIASVIAMAGDEIVMPKNALMMLHDPWGIAVGTSGDLRKEADTLDKIKDSLISVFSKRTGNDAGKIEAILSKETWMTGAEAVDQGFATKVTGPVRTSAFRRAKLSRVSIKRMPDALIAGFPKVRNTTRRKGRPA